MPDYQEFGYQNDNYSHIHTYLTPSLLKILDKSINKKILDIGCGNGWRTNILIDNGFDAFGIDASVSGIQLAKRKQPSRFYLQDLTNNSLPPELNEIKFDTILSTEVIEHLYSPKKYLNFCKNILERSPRGELIISTPYHGYFKNLALALTGKMDKHFTVKWEGGHIKFWSKKTLTESLEENGFRVTKFVGCGRIPYLWKSMIIKAVINK